MYTLGTQGKISPHKNRKCGKHTLIAEPDCIHETANGKNSMFVFLVKHCCHVKSEIFPLFVSLVNKMHTESTIMENQHPVHFNMFEQFYFCINNIKAHRSLFEVTDIFVRF